MAGVPYNFHKFLGLCDNNDLNKTDILGEDVFESNETSIFPEFTDYDNLKELLRKNDKDAAKSCIIGGCRLNIDCTDYTYDGTPLHLAVSLEYPDIVELLLEKGASVKVLNNSHETPLMLAAIVGNRQIIDMILSKTRPKNYSNRHCFSHFHIACMQNNVDLVQKFLSSGAYINKSIKKESFFWPGYTPLHFAVEFKSIETAQVLLEKGADITVQDSRGLTPLHLAFRKKKQIID